MLNFGTSKGKKKNVCFLASGRGSNFTAVAEKIRKRKIKSAELGTLITDNPEAKSIEIAKQMGMKVKIVDYAKYRGRRADFDAAILEAINESKPDLIVAAGFLKILGADVIRSYKNQILNIHPSLLPSFPGLKAQEQALEYGVKFTGCTVHFVDEGLDSGPIIIQRVVAIDHNDTAATVRSKVLAEEHKALPEAVGLFCDGKLQVAGRKVIIKN